MSNHLSIAMVTKTLRDMIADVIENEVTSETGVTMMRPSVSGSGSAHIPTSTAPAAVVNIYLYQVTPSATWRNADLPTRRSDGSLVRRPLIGLDLHYLLTFHGNENELEPQRLMGRVIQALHEKPFLSREMIRAAQQPEDLYDFLKESDLADATEQVKFFPMNLSLDELSKLWSVFFQTPYVLSVAYQASVVLIESEVTPEKALPVTKPLLYSHIFNQPVIKRIVSENGPNQPILGNSVIEIQGKGLLGEVTRLHVDDTGDLEPLESREDKIRLRLDSPPFPADALRAGLHRLQVIHYTPIGKPPMLHHGIESNVSGFLMRPSIPNIQVQSSSEIHVDFRPKVGRHQRVFLLLNECASPKDRPSNAYTFPAPPDNGVVPPASETGTITFSTPGILAGDYFVRVQVDGAENWIDLNPESPAFGPKVTIQ